MEYGADESLGLAASSVKRAVSAWIRSIRSVASPITSTTLPREGASSWMPPESVKSRWPLFISQMSAK